MITVILPPTAPALVHAAVADALTARKISDKSKQVFKAFARGDAVQVRALLDATFDVMTQSITRFGYSSQRHDAARKHEALYTWVRAAEQFAAAEGGVDAPGADAITEAIALRAQVEQELAEERRRHWAANAEAKQTIWQLEQRIKEMERPGSGEIVRAMLESERDAHERTIIARDEAQAAVKRLESDLESEIELRDAIAAERDTHLNELVNVRQDLANLQSQEVTIPAGANVVINAKKVVIKN